MSDGVRVAGHDFLSNLATHKKVVGPLHGELAQSKRDAGLQLSSERTGTTSTSSSLNNKHFFVPLDQVTRLVRVEF